MKKGIRIAVAGIKGGTGKSTLAMVLGTVLRETLNAKVVLIDADVFNRSIIEQRTNEILFHKQNEELVREIAKRRTQAVRYTDPLPVERLGLMNLNNAVEIESKYPSADLFIYDLKGSDGDYDTFEFLTQMDYILFPIVLENQHMEANYYWIQGMNFACRYVKDVRLKRVMMLFNFVQMESLDMNLQGWWKYTAKQNSIDVLSEVFYKDANVGKSITQIKSPDEDYFQSISVVPPEDILSKTNFIGIVNNIISIIGEGSNRSITKTPRDRKTKSISTEELISLANDKISFLSMFVNRLEKQKLPQTQLSMLQVCLDALNEEEMRSLMTTGENSVVREKHLEAPLGAKAIDEHQNGEEGDPDDDFDEVELKAIELYKKFLREERKNRNK